MAYVGPAVAEGAETLDGAGPVLPYAPWEGKRVAAWVAEQAADS